MPSSATAPDPSDDDVRPSARDTATGVPRRALVGWAMFDWANSPYVTIVITFVFSAYFASQVAVDEARGQALWAYTNSLSGLAIALSSPVLGAIADAGGRRKPWIAVFTATCVAGAALLWFVRPDPAWVPWAMVWVIVSSLGFEFGIVFNNAMLPDLVPEERLGRWSGWGWGLGYAGGLVALAVALFGFVMTDRPWLGLDRDSLEHVRVAGPLCAVWFAAFVWPLFVFTPDRPSSGLRWRTAIRRGLGNLRGTLGHLRRYRNIALFLVARMIYADGLATVFAMGGPYAAGVFGMELQEVILFGILLNLTAGLGAALFSWIDDALGSRRTILIALTGLIVASSAAVLTTSTVLFWIAGAATGVFVGPAQSASRSLMARLTPSGMSTEFFGLYALTGKATAFLGPLVVGALTAATGSQRVGMATVVLFFVVGGVMLLRVREERAAPPA